MSFDSLSAWNNKLTDSLQNEFSVSPKEEPTFKVETTTLGVKGEITLNGGCDKSWSGDICPKNKPVEWKGKKIPYAEFEKNFKQNLANDLGIKEEDIIINKIISDFLWIIYWFSNNI